MVVSIVLLVMCIGFGIFIASQLRERRRHEDAPPDRSADGATERGRAEVDAWTRQRDHGGGV